MCRLELLVALVAVSVVVACGGNTERANVTNPDDVTEPDEVTRPDDHAVPADPVAVTDEEAILAIAKAIEDRRAEFPQLAEFSAAEHCDPARRSITYGHNMPPSTSRGGWTAGVPAPDDDGIWFYIDFHDPSSTEQIHTQPVVAPRHRGDKRVMFLILEGENTRSVVPTFAEIMAAHGVVDGPPS